MRRRGYLGLLAGGTGFLAGCNGGDAGSGRTGTTPTLTGTAAEATPGTASGPRSDTADGESGASTLFVDADASGGDRGTREAPFDRISEALKQAKPGDTIEVRPGEYFESPRTVRSGTRSNPITITGPPDAVLRGRRTDGYSGGFRVTHSHIHITGLTIDGLQDPERPEDPDAYMNIAIHTLPAEQVYLEDLVFEPHAIGNTRGAMITLSFVEDVSVGGFQVVGPAGVDFMLGEKVGHFGEVVYVGSPPDTEFNEIDRTGEIAGVDATNDVRVHHIDASAGHHHIELVDVKMGAHDVTVEYCTSVGARIPPDNDNSSAVHLGGTDVTFRWNRIASAGYHAMDVGNYGPYNDNYPHPDAPDAGTGNAIYGNELVGSGATAINYTEETGESKQRVVCGNIVDTATEGDPTADCPPDVPTGEGIGHTGGDSPFA